ncbi:MAG: cytochrome C [Rhizomicrobium sp.]
MRASWIAPLIEAAAFLAFGSTAANAVPAFAEQTGQPCQACHVGGFGPQLTPFGRQFKLDGYTMRAGTGFSDPLSAMAVVSYVHSQSGQPSAPAPHYATNDNLTLDQASLFVAGGIGDHFGGFTQWTYDGVGRAAAWDNLDLRAVDHVAVGGDDVLLGLSLNNAPGVQDSWNTLAAWGFPYTGSDLAPAPAAGTVMDGALAQGVLGLSAYAWWNSSIYAEFGLYWTPGHGFLRAMGVDPADSGILESAAPYVRLAYQKDYGDRNFEIGAFGLFPRLYPGGDKSAGTSDRYGDTGIDASYQFTGDPDNIYTVNARYTHESQNLAATLLLGGAAHASNDLDDLRIDASYYWKNMIGGSVGAFDTTGSRDAVLYAGNRTSKPDSAGFTFQADYTPFGGPDAPLGGRLAVRVGLQYTVYTKFDGASSNFDGLGHSASDNNTLRLFLWTAL